MVALRFAGFAPLLRGYPKPVGGLGYTAAHMRVAPVSGATRQPIVQRPGSALQSLGDHCLG